MANPITYLGSPAAITLTDDGTWRTYALAGLGVPAGASGVLLRSRFSSATSNDNFSVRKTGSTDNYIAAHLATPTYIYTMCGVDASAQIDIQVEDGGAGACSVEVMAYFDSGSVKFLTNCSTFAPGSINTWTDWDISSATGADTAIAAILYLHSGRANPTQVGWRKNGSSENILASHCGFTGFRYIGCVIVPVDASEILEVQWASSSYGDFKLIGYVTRNYVTIDPGDDVSLGSTGAWTDITQAGALAQMIDAFASSDTQQLGFRKNGDSSTTGYGVLEANPAVSSRLPALVECDGSGVIEAQIDNTGVDMYRRGYFTVDTGAVNTQTLTSNVVLTDEALDYVFFTRRLESFTTLFDELVAIFIGSGNTINTKVLESLLTVIDGAVASQIRNRLLQDTIVISEGQTEQYINTNIVADDFIEVSDQLTLFCRFFRIGSDTVTVTDSLVSSVVNYLIVSRVMTSNLDVSDEAVRFFCFTAILDSLLETFDEALTPMQRFILLSDAILVNDDVASLYVPDSGTPGPTFNPRVVIGFDQPKIDIGGYSLN